MHGRAVTHAVCLRAPQAVRERAPRRPLLADRCKAACERSWRPPADGVLGLIMSLGRRPPHSASPNCCDRQAGGALRAPLSCQRPTSQGAAAHSDRIPCALCSHATVGDCRVLHCRLCGGLRSTAGGRRGAPAGCLRSQQSRAAWALAGQRLGAGSESPASSGDGSGDGGGGGGGWRQAALLSHVCTHPALPALRRSAPWLAAAPLARTWCCRR